MGHLKNTVFTITAAALFLASPAGAVSYDLIVSRDVAFPASDPFAAGQQFWQVAGGPRLNNNGDVAARLSFTGFGTTVRIDRNQAPVTLIDQSFGDPIIDKNGDVTVLLSNGTNYFRKSGASQVIFENDEANALFGSNTLDGVNRIRTAQDGTRIGSVGVKTNSGPVSASNPVISHIISFQPDATGITSLVSEGATSPVSNRSYVGLRGANINDDGDFAFEADIDSSTCSLINGSTPSGCRGAVLVNRGSGVEALAVTDENTPLSGFNYSTLISLRGLTDSGAVAIQANIDNGAGDNRQLFAINDGNGTRAVVDSGQDLGLLTGDSMFDGLTLGFGNEYGIFEDDDGNGLALIGGRLLDNGSSVGSALFRETAPGGPLEAIIYSGMEITLADGTQRVLENFAIDNGGDSISNDGRFLAFSVGFEGDDCVNQCSGIILADFDGSTTVPGASPDDEIPVPGALWLALAPVVAILRNARR